MTRFDRLSRAVADQWRLWIGLLVPPAVWGARLLAGWAIAELACAGGWADGATYLVVQTVTTLAAAGLTAWSGVISWSRYRPSASDDRFDPATSKAFLSLSGSLSALIFLLLIVLEGSSVYLVTCG